MLTQKPICTVQDCDRPIKGRGLCSMHHQRWLKSLSPEERNFPRLTLQQAADRHGGVEFQNDGCIVWTGKTDRLGYGRFNYGQRKSIRAHRYAYEFLVGPIPDGMEIDHHCGNRRCVNPHHLRVTTRKENCENRQGANHTSGTGVRGVHYEKSSGKYRAYVTHNYKRTYLGRFNTLEEAEAAAIAKRLALHTHNTRDKDEEIHHGSWWGIRL